MRFFFKIGRSLALPAIGLVIMAGAFAPGLAAASAGLGFPASATATPVTLLPPAEIAAPRLLVAQSQTEAQLAVRLQELEDLVRALNGKIEEQQHVIDLLLQQMNTMQEDNEFRFQQLEGGAGKKTDAATQATGVTPDGALPQTPEVNDTTNLPAPPPLDSAAETPAPVATDGLGDSADPLVGSNQTGAGQLGTLDPNSVESRPLDLSLDGGQTLSDGDATAQYQAGYDAIVRGDYAFAEDQLRQFIALYPNDPNAPDATNWLGEALLQRQAYEEAADVLTTGYQNYQRSARAPDIMLRLGIALNGAGEPDTSCRLYFEIAKRFPKQPAAFMQKLKAEQANAQCQVQ